MPTTSLKPYGARDVAEARIPAFYLRVLLRTFAQDDEAVATLLGQVGINSGQLSAPITEIHLWQYLRFTDNLTQQNPNWATEIPFVTYASAHGPIGVACLSAATLADSLQTVVRFGHLRTPYFRLHTTQGDERCALRVESLVELGTPRRRPLLESLLLSIQGALEATLQRPMEGALFDIAGPRTAEASGYGEIFHSPVHFDAPASAVLVPCEWLDIPNPLADPGAHADALSELEATERRFRQEGWVVREVVRVLKDSNGVPPLKGVAASVQVSSRTLERLLTEAHTSYRQLVEEHQRHRATRLLRDERLPVSEVAYRLGYSDPANFSRACRRWFGTSPSSYRKLHGPTR